MTYRDDFIAAERDAAEKRVVDILEHIEHIYADYHGECRELLRLALTTPNSILHYVFGFGISSGARSYTKGSAEFPGHLFYSHMLNSYELATTLDFLGRWISHDIEDDGDCCVAYYKEIRSGKFNMDMKLEYCDQTDPEAIPFVTQSAELWHKDSGGKKGSYATQAYIDCVNYWREQERQNTVRMFKFDADRNRLVDGQDFGWHMARAFETPDAIFGKKLVADLKAKYGE